jgi:hypothetical protein
MNGGYFFWLIGGLEHAFVFHILGIIIRLIFFRGVETTNQLGCIWTNNSRNRTWQWYNPLQMEALMGNLSTSMGIFRERSHD